MLKQVKLKGKMYKLSDELAMFLPGMIYCWENGWKK